LWSTVSAPPPLHPIGVPAHPDAASGAGCATCAWRYVGGPGRRAERCRPADGKRVELAWPACERYGAGAGLRCQPRGACGRGAYGAVEVGPRDPMRKKRPELVVVRGDFIEVKRAGDRCAALDGGLAIPAPDAPAGQLTTTRYRCTIYDDRPRTCRDFT